MVDLEAVRGQIGVLQPRRVDEHLLGGEAGAEVVGNVLGDEAGGDRSVATHVQLGVGGEAGFGAAIKNFEQRGFS